MAWFSSLFIGLCMVVIAGSVSAVLYFQVGTDLGAAVIIGTAILVAEFLVNIMVMRSRDRNEARHRSDMLDGGIGQIDQELQNLERRLTAIENGFPNRARAEIEPMYVEIEVLGTLVKQIAETVADLETQIVEAPQIAHHPQNDYHGQPQASLAAPRNDLDRPAFPGSHGYAPNSVAPGAANGWEQPDGKLWSNGAGAPKSRNAAADAALREAVRSAIDASRIDLYLQPIVSLPQRQVRFYEALTRLRADDGEIMLPADYIEIAERNGLMPGIDNTLLLRSVQVLRRLSTRNRSVGLFCNVSPSTLVDDNFFPGFIDFMQKNQTLAEYMVFEFTQAAVEEMGAVENESLAALANLGFQFSVDQVTNLRTNFRALNERGFHYAKISADRLLGRIPTDTGDIHPEDVSSLLARYGVQLIADQIETEAQVIELLDFGIHFGQGFLFSPPRPVRSDVVQGGAQPPADRKRVAS
ncbi:EAL domain-containing protein [Breoghania sp. L-A4]|uniref:EAL domain-containing protein n=1 Tax=Breoghania sp. L-A4 TaxID=2304600 RepID=UPI000E35F088|nr:EAL domain-containing protein [Breoghania sp. L-A4]AXS39438.1 EAL domain-containing protein [Breoghania sp. L-A4]